MATRTILPPRLDALLGALTNVERHQLVIRGWSRECAENEHVWALWMTGIYSPVPPPHLLAAMPAAALPTFRVALHQCTHCEAIEVRDRTFDRLTDEGRLVASGRRDDVLGWYTGSRKNSRTYS